MRRIAAVMEKASDPGRRVRASTLALRDQFRDQHPDVLTTNLREGLLAEARVHMQSQHSLVALDRALAEPRERGVGHELLVGRFLEGDRLRELIGRRGFRRREGSVAFSQGDLDLGSNQLRRGLAADALGLAEAIVVDADPPDTLAETHLDAHWDPSVPIGPAPCQGGHGRRRLAPARSAP